MKRKARHGIALPSFASAKRPGLTGIKEPESGRAEGVRISAFGHAGSSHYPAAGH